MPLRIRAKRSPTNLSNVADHVMAVLKSGGYWSIAELTSELVTRGVGLNTEKDFGNIRRQVPAVLCVCEKLGHIECVVQSRRKNRTVLDAGLRLYHWVGAVAKSPYEVAEEIGRAHV